MGTLPEILGIVGVLGWLLLFFSIVFGPLLWIYILLATKYWPLAILYVFWIIYDRKAGSHGGRTPELTRNFWVMRLLRSYFPASVIKTADLDASKNYVFGYHPHGAFSTGCHANFLCGGNKTGKLFPGIEVRVLTLNSNFHSPIYREICLSMHSCSVSRESINYLLGKGEGGNALLLIPGGTREGLACGVGRNELILKNRKGFIKIAIENGSPLVPIYGFGENELYSHLIPNPKGSWIRRIEDKIVDLTGLMPLPVWGRGLFPKKVPITAVVGAPILVDKITHPSPQYVDEIHGKYMTALAKLYYAHREKYGDPKLDIIFE